MDMTITLIVKTGVVTLIYLLNYYLWGLLLVHICKRKDEHLFLIIPTGFFLYGLIFFVVIFPFFITFAFVWHSRFLLGRL